MGRYLGTSTVPYMGYDELILSAYYYQVPGYGKVTGSSIRH